MQLISFFNLDPCFTKSSFRQLPTREASLIYMRMQPIVLISWRVDPIDINDTHCPGYLLSR